MKPLLDIRTIEDLNRALSEQRRLTLKAATELGSVRKRCYASAGSLTDDELAALTVERETEFLRSFAEAPTLSEFARSPALGDLYRSGATFAVAVAVGEAVLKSVRQRVPAFERAHRALLAAMLAELASDRDEPVDLVDVFLRSLKIELDERGLSPEERDRLVRAMASPLVHAMIDAAERYGLVEELPEEGLRLLPLGARTLAHLADAQRFVEAVAEAHARLQAEGPFPKAEARTGAGAGA